MGEDPVVVVQQHTHGLTDDTEAEPEDDVADLLILQPVFQRVR